MQIEKVRFHFDQSKLFVLVYQPGQKLILRFVGAKILILLNKQFETAIYFIGNIREHNLYLYTRAPAPMGGKLSMSALSNALIKSLVVLPTGMNSTVNSLSYYIRKLSLKIEDKGAVRYHENESCELDKKRNLFYFFCFLHMLNVYLIRII